MHVITHLRSYFNDCLDKNQLLEHDWAIIPELKKYASIR